MAAMQRLWSVAIWPAGADGGLKVAISPQARVLVRAYRMAEPALACWGSDRQFPVPTRSSLDIYKVRWAGLIIPAKLRLGCCHLQLCSKSHALLIARARIPASHRSQVLRRGSQMYRPRRLPARVARIP
ncbi:hypothetical protein F5Y18DRAFT_166198 [Xylariaceae sp. FL1019]|nr:hypothetical protein F5Y18DRAFT_166198 [Xylariaceae sp. FL1019]